MRCENLRSTFPICVPAPASVRSLIFFFNDTATTEIYTLSLHAALPISAAAQRRVLGDEIAGTGQNKCPQSRRSEEHTSELQSHLNLVCRLLLEKKKPNIHTPA